MQLFLLSSIFYQIFDNLPVHQRLTTKEIHFQIAAASGVCDQEIQCFLSNLITHQLSVPMIFAFFCKAVATGKVAVMCNVQAQSFDYSRTFLEVHNIIFVFIFCKQFSVFYQGSYFFTGFFHLSFTVCTGQFCYNLLRCMIFVQSDHIIGNIIYYMDRTTVYIKNNVITIIFILVNQMQFLSFYFYIKNQRKKLLFSFSSKRANDRMP